MVEEGKIGLFSLPANASRVSHLFYANDVMLFSNASKDSIQQLIKIFKLYEDWSGQCIYFEKLTIYFSKLMHRRCISEIIIEIGFSEGKLPLTYLGVPIMDGRVKISHFDSLVEKVSKKLA